MNKAHKLISISEEVAKDIEFRHNKYGFNFSEWVNEEYTKQFMSEQAINERVSKLKEDITECEEMLARRLETRRVYEIVALNREEKRYLQGVPKKLAGGFNKKSILEAFNNMYHKQLTSDQFNKLVDMWGGRHDSS
jgi:hypothetical protein